MSGPVILLLDTDPNSRRMLHQAMTRAGFRVAAVASPFDLVDMLGKYRFDIVILDAWIENADRHELFTLIKQQQPRTEIIYISDQDVYAWAVESFRWGAVDFLLKPVERDELVASIGRAVDKAASQRPPEPPAPAPAPVPAVTADKKLLRDVLDFNEECLKLFLSLERQNIYLEEQSAAAEGRSVAVEIGSLQLIIVHSDDDILDTITRQAVGIPLSTEQVYTGGEALDLVSRRPFNVLIMSTQLPDMDGEMLAYSLKPQYPSLEIIVIDNWGSPSASAQILSTSGDTSAVHPLRTGRDLASLLDEIQNRRVQKAEEKRFANTFRDRHESFIKSYAEMKVRIERNLAS